MICRISACEEREDGTVRLRVSYDDGEEQYTLTSDEYADLACPQTGDTLTDGEYETLCALRRRREALRRALTLLSYGEQSAASLYRKLTDRGVSCEDADYAVAAVRKKGYLPEEDMVRRQIVVCAERKMWGPRRIRAFLLAHGFSRAVIDRAFAEAEASGEPDFSAVRARLLAKKGETDPRRRAALLYRYGF